MKKEKINSLYDNYDNILDINRIENVFETIKVNTKHKDKIFIFELFYSTNINKILTVLEKKNYIHGKYNIFLLKENKYRIIMSENMSDKIINHLVSDYVLSPIINRRLIPMNVATRPGYGTDKGFSYVKKYINSMKINHDKIYVLKCDIEKYFYSIDHKILIDKIKKIITDKNLINLIETIIMSTDYSYINKEIDKVINIEKNNLKQKNVNDMKSKYEELDKIPKYKAGKGLPIGNMTSQILAIFYLNDLDHFIKEKLKIKHYIRYMDDFIIFHHDKEYIKYCLKKINQMLKDIKLNLNKKTQIIEVHQGFVFLGYRFKLKNKKLVILLNGKTKRRIYKNIKLLRNESYERRKCSIASYKGYIMRSNVNNKELNNRFKQINTID